MSGERQDPGTDAPEVPETDAPETDARDDATEDVGTESETDKLRATLRKVRDERREEVRKLKAELAALKKDSEEATPPGPTAEEKANARVIRSAARTALATAGVTDTDAQKSVLRVLDLSGIDVDDNGDPDEDQVADLVETLTRAFGAAKRSGKIPAPRVDTRDRNGSDAPSADRDKARRLRILQRGR